MAFVTFENPLYLWYLVSIPLLIFSHFYFLRYAKHRGLKFANFEAMKRVSGEKFLTKNYFILGLRIVALFCLIFAAAGTTIWYKGEANANDFVLAIDVSASMTSQDVNPTRLDAAKDAAVAFLQSLRERGIRTKVGVITFSGATYIEQLVTDDLGKVQDIILDIRVRQEGGTDISGAIVTGTNMLLTSEKGKSIVLISDGSQTVSAKEDRSMENAMRYARDSQIIIHTIGIGTDEGPLGYLPEYYNASAVFNEETIINLANYTGGTTTNVETFEELTEAYRQISLSSSDAQLDIKLSYSLLLIAIFLIFVEWGLISTRFRRLP